MDPLPDFSAMSLTEVAKALSEKSLPPVDQWHPVHCGNSEMRIARDGTWYHQGSPIGREAMVRLFSTILRKLAFRLNTGDLIVAGADNVLRFETKADGPHPYLHVRGGMEALVARSVYYELANLALEEAGQDPAVDGEPVGLWSEGVFFAMSDA
jgi:hypothetical protein